MPATADPELRQQAGNDMHLYNFVGEACSRSRRATRRPSAGAKKGKQPHSQAWFREIGARVEKTNRANQPRPSTHPVH
jgi:hypothetical protein